MKTNLLLLIALMLTLSTVNAQSTEMIDANANSKTVSVNNDVNDVIENDSLLIDATKLKSTISRTSSDIRIYLNRKRKAGNISFVFFKINKAVKA